MTDTNNDQTITPWQVIAKNGINYFKLIEQFGCDPIDGVLIKRFEQVTNIKAHTWLRRGLFFSNKDLTKILDQYEAGNPVYLYTGRGPSSEAMHLGHLIPFIFTAYLQKALSAVVVIQMSDDEKYYFKGSSEGKSIEHYNRLTYQNTKDIIACDFDVNKTFIFSNYRTLGGALYSNVVRINQTTTGNQLRGIYGLNLDNNIGELSWPSFQCAPAYSNSFPDILHPNGLYEKEQFDGSKDYVGSHIYCLVPMAIDQDPYFRMARDFATKYSKNGYLKPATIHTKFLVGLGGIKAKMSSSDNTPTIFLTDDINHIKKTIKRYAYSGGKQTKELHEKYGGNLHTDVSYQYLLYFMHDDNLLKEIAHKYRSGIMMSGEIKEIMSNVIGDLIAIHQEKVANITDDIIRQFFTRNRPFDLSIEKRTPIQLESDEQYLTYGINFDSTFGAVAPEGAEQYDC